MNFFTKQKQTHRFQKQTYGYKEEIWLGGDKLGVFFSIYTLLCT